MAQIPQGSGAALMCLLGLLVVLVFSCSSAGVRSTLTLLVPQVLADHHHATVPANHLALVTDRLDAGVNLHRAYSGVEVLGISRRSVRVAYLYR